MSRVLGGVKPYYRAYGSIRQFSSSSLWRDQHHLESGLPFNLSNKDGLKAYLRTPVFAQNLVGISSNIEPEADTLNSPKTLPYELQIPPKDPSKSGFSRLTAIGKEYLKLYKTGIINVWKNRKESNAILKRLSAKNTDELISSILEKQSIDRIKRNIQQTQNPESDDNTVKIQSPGEGNLTRAEYQLLLRTPMDFLKLPLFTLTFCIFAEVTPLLVIIVPTIVPSTCTIPRQQKKDVSNNNKNINAMKALFQAPENADSLPKFLSRSAFNLSTTELAAGVKALNLYSSLIPMALVSKASMQQRLQNHIARIKCDDVLIGWNGGVWNLSTAELLRACHARAIATEGLSTEELRVNLFSWIVNFDEGRYDAGFLFYPINNAPGNLEYLKEVAKDF